MPAADTVLLPLCLGLTLLGLILTGLAGRRGNKGRVVQGVALALAPVALYFTGLLRLLWNGAAAVGSWAMALTMSRTVWLGLALLVLCVVLWVVGGVVARRTPKKSRQRKTANAAAGRPAVAGDSGPVKGGAPAAQARRRGAASPASKAPVDEDAADMADIEALLKSRGIN